ncbi:hypothetical protein Tco_0222120 [Tanacetum coccineum]
MIAQKHLCLKKRPHESTDSLNRDSGSDQFVIFEDLQVPPKQHQHSCILLIRCFALISAANCHITKATSNAANPRTMSDEFIYEAKSSYGLDCSRVLIKEFPRISMYVIVESGLIKVIQRWCSINLLINGLTWGKFSYKHAKPESAYKLRKKNISLMTQKSWEKWSTLGEPSGKWDYYVKYDAPPDTTSIEEIAATSWGDEFSDDEVTQGKVTILEEISDWDDDERSSGKILVIQERLAQNQQEFLDEYLPQWDEHPQSFYRPDYQFGYPQGKGKIFSGGYGEYYNSQWTLPPAWTEFRVMLVLPADPGLWSKVISRWESITINRLNNQTWFDNKAKLAFMENLLGESEKLMWQQWRTVFPEAYSALEAIADEPQNITSHVRQLILLEDPYRGEEDIVSADFDSSVYSISEGEGDTHQSISVMVQDTPVEEANFMATLWR